MILLLHCRHHPSSVFHLVGLLDSRHEVRLDHVPAAAGNELVLRVAGKVDGDVPGKRASVNIVQHSDGVMPFEGGATTRKPHVTVCQVLGDEFQEILFNLKVSLR